MSSQPPAQYASEQDLPTTDHASVFVPTHDKSSSSPAECENCHHPVAGSQATKTFPPEALGSDSDSQASSSDAGSLQTNGSAAGTEQKRKQSKPLLDTLLKKNAQWR